MKNRKASSSSSSSDLSSYTDSHSSSLSRSPKQQTKVIPKLREFSFIVISNLSKRVNELHIKEIFGYYGRVENAFVDKEYKSEYNKCIVQLEEKGSQLAKLIECLDKSIIDEREIKINVFELSKDQLNSFNTKIIGLKSLLDIFYKETAKSSEELERQRNISYKHNKYDRRRCRSRSRDRKRRSEESYSKGRHYIHKYDRKKR